jgi:hypothetical protein
MKIDGACHCGRITYEAIVDPLRVSVCNCSDCQVLSGSPFRVSVPSEPGTFRLLSGAPAVYVKTTAHSGNRRRQGFCASCGSPIYASADADAPDTYSLRVGGLRQRAQLPPQRRIWCSSALAWSQDVSGIPGVDRQ